MSAVSTHNDNVLTYAARLHALFQGAEERHGTYDPARLRLVGSKMEMKDQAGNGPRDVKGPPTPELWEQHLAGTRPLGISPLREDGMCRWGVIDIDVYDGLDHAALSAEIARLDLPLVVCVSKSKGAHLYLLVTDWMPQAVMNAALVTMAGRLSNADAETYPPATGLGNWINMPMWSSTERCGVKVGGLEMDVAEFIAAAEGTRQSVEAVAALAERCEPGAGATSNRAMRKLQEYAAEIAGLSDGRKRALNKHAFAMGKYVLKGRIDEGTVASRLIAAGIAAGLPRDVAESHVNNGLADRLKSGTSMDDDDGGDWYPEIEGIVVLTGGEDDLWRVTLAGYGDITLPVREIMHYYTFNVKCASKLGAVFRHMKTDSWYDRVREARARAEFEALPQDETVDYMMREQLRAFCMDRHRSDSIDEIALGKPIHVEEEDRIYFRFEDFDRFLRMGSSRFKNGTTQTIGALIKKAVGKDNYRQTMKVIKGRPKGMPVKWVRMSIFDKSVGLPLPQTERPPL